jgi:NAD+ synthase (glutamine-hydrolysing)
MPSKYNSDLTKNAAKQLAENLGIDYKIVPIQESVELTTAQLKNAGFELNSVVVENIQARDRGSRVLSAISGILGGVFVNNGNKTETALGYCTLYGDVSGAIAPIADMYKGQVYEMARYINKRADREIIPMEIINVVPSAELSADQDVTKGKGDPMNYPYHDKLIRAFVEWRLDPAEILELYDEGVIEKEFGLSEKIETYFTSRDEFVADLEHKWKLYKVNIFKRIQAPPIIAVSKRAFGFDLREAQNGVYFTDEFLQKKSP